jgi:hypothetical protein
MGLRREVRPSAQRLREAEEEEKKEGWRDEGKKGRREEGKKGRRDKLTERDIGRSLPR